MGSIEITMEQLKDQIERHYFRGNLYESILEGVKQKNLDPGNIKRSDIEGVDEFHVRGSQVSKKIATYANITGLKALDIGCGIGGPARMLREEYHCDVTGIDINREYIETAQKLTALVGMKEGIAFIQGDATDLPFNDGSFDLVWTQHVQMNIQDKEKFYGEISRMLKTGGLFIHYEILSQGNGQIEYPVPWANDERISFLSAKEDLEKIIEAAGLKKIRAEDETAKGIEFFENLLAGIKEKGVPAIGLNLLMGDSTRLKITNLLNGLKNGSIELQSGLFMK